MNAKLFNTLVAVILCFGIIAFIVQIRLTDIRKERLDNNYAAQTERELSQLGDEQPINDPVNN